MQASAGVIMQFGKDSLRHPPYRIEVDASREGDKTVQMSCRGQEFLLWCSLKGDACVIAGLAHRRPTNFVETDCLIEVFAHLSLFTPELRKTLSQLQTHGERLFGCSMHVGCCGIDEQ
jgi:hypothetical protein